MINLNALTTALRGRGRHILAGSMAMAFLMGAFATPSYAGPFARRHPRRAEVLHRDNNLNRRINNDKGDLGGHYNQLKSEDRSIRRQEQRDARRNGGHITRGEQRRLNREENHVNRQIQRDHQ